MYALHDTLHALLHVNDLKPPGARHRFSRRPESQPRIRKRQSLRLPTSRYCTRSLTATKATVCSASSAGVQSNTNSSTQASHDKTVLVWFKHDLRIDDHPGLQIAINSGARVIPVFCCDPRQCLHLLRLPHGLEGLLGAVKALKESLQRLGSDLVVLLGDMEVLLPQAATSYAASSIILEEEVEYKWHKAVDKVKAALPEDVTMQPWRMHIFQQQPYQQDYTAFKKQRGKAQPPLDCPEKLPVLPAGLDLGEMPSADELQAAVKAAFEGKQTAEVAAAFGDLPVSQAWLSSMSRKLCEGELAVQAALHQYLECAEASADSVSNKDLLTAVLSSEIPATPLGSFPAIFNQALALGTLSRRRIYHEAQQQQQAKQKQGRRWRATAGNKLAFDVPSRSAAATAEVSDFHWHLAANDRIRDTKTGDAPRHWRWRGFITDYYTAEAAPQHAQASATDSSANSTTATQQPLTAAQDSNSNNQGAAQQADAVTAHSDSNSSDGVQHGGAERQPSDNAAEGRQPVSDAPAFLLVHGFGAFGEQWRGQIQALTAAGYQVYAPTFPGYGRSEKQSLAYSQELWRDFLRDFVLEVVQRPVVVAGNSIGGFISASLAADYPSLVKGLVLLNSAGNVNTKYTPPSSIPPSEAASPGRGPPKLLVDAASQGLFLFLRTSVARTLTRLYPVAPDNADEWLGQEILRAAADPGALGVFRSVFYLPKPRPLNYLVQDMFRGPTLVLQGAKDPLSNAKDRAMQLKVACSNVEVELLDAGHCPHDEVPHLVNRSLLDFIHKVEQSQSSEAQQVMLESVSVL